MELVESELLSSVRAENGNAPPLTAASLFLQPDRAVRQLPDTPPPPSGSFTYAELFAGIGGFAVGLEAIGGRCVFASEIEPQCVALYRQNFPESADSVAGDIWAVVRGGRLAPGSALAHPAGRVCVFVCVSVCVCALVAPIAPITA